MKGWGARFPRLVTVSFFKPSTRCSPVPIDLYAMQFDRLTVWIMDVPNTAGTRAITIGIALGVVATSLRILLGVDRSYLGQD